jgi:hypothetical protein
MKLDREICFQCYLRRLQEMYSSVGKRPDEADSYIFFRYHWDKGQLHCIYKHDGFNFNTEIPELCEYYLEQILSQRIKRDA